MIEFIKGRLIEKYPTHAIVEANGLGYFVNISLTTYSNLPETDEIKLLIYYSVNVDVRSGSSNHVLFGFSGGEERSLFKLLISISGVSANTARMMLSSLNPSELGNAIGSGNVAVIQSVKGIGPKLAQRIVTELKDKIIGLEFSSTNSFVQSNTISEEALSALLALGFDKSKANKVVNNIVNQEEEISVEALIKLALQQM
ncbi:MAG: Holliday junction branch migration protein RuvA [Flavobacteriales bacterium]|nr:Holliday junction branch migration protein RuvA [Flavobacteriales bacterium]